jgi:hypothetical protein
VVDKRGDVKGKKRKKRKKPRGFSPKVVAAAFEKPPRGFRKKVVAEALGGVDSSNEKHPHGFRKEVVRAVMKAAIAKLTKKQRAWRRKRRQAKLDALDKARRELRKAEAERKALEKAKASKTKQKAKAAEVRSQAQEVEQKAEELQEQTHAQQRREHGLPVDFTQPASDALIASWKESFDRLLEIAGRTGQISKKDYGPRKTWREKIQTDDRDGDAIFHRINSLVDETTSEEILYQMQRNADRLPGRRNIWMISFTFCAMGDSLIGYGNRVLDADNEEEAHNFQMGYESTGVWKTKVSAMAKAREIIEEYAADMTTLIFLNRYTVWNFDFVAAP